MLASGITREQLAKAAAEIGVAVVITTLNEKNTRHRVKVNPLVHESQRTASGNRRAGTKGDAKYQRISASMFGNGRRVHAVCWHGFRDYFRACFKLAPDAVFRTSMDTWRGAQDFEARFRASGHRNIGSQACPVMAAEACRCGEEGMAV
jgi:hypothetical protein